ncbi:MAG: flagella synthesis protein FlgN [Pseudomonadota bacterium]
MMTGASKPSPAEQLQLALRQETAIAQRLYEVMAQEQSALQRMDTSSIQALAQEKSRLLAALDEQLSQRQRLVPNGQQPGALDALIARLPAPIASNLKQLADQLRELMLRCHTQNELNGRIIAASRRSVERSLSLLRGQQPDAVLYTPNGAATRLGPARRFASA